MLLLLNRHKRLPNNLMSRKVSSFSKPRYTLEVEEKVLLAVDSKVEFRFLRLLSKFVT